MKLKDKALLVIEAITSDDEIVNLQMRPPEDDTTKLLLAKLSSIYRFAHIARSPCCPGSHETWIQELDKMYNYLHRYKII